MYIFQLQQMSETMNTIYSINTQGNIYLVVFTMLVMWLITYTSLSSFFQNKKVYIATVCFCMYFNPYIFHLILENHFINSISQISLFLFLLLKFTDNTLDIWYLLLGISTSINPSNVLILILVIQESQIKRLNKCVYFVLGSLLSFVIFQFYEISIVDHYKEMYFPAFFRPKSNLMWILYAHMFSRYMKLYQLVFIILPISSLYLVSPLNFTKGYKILLILYIKAYCSYQYTELSKLFTIIIISIYLFKEIKALIDIWSFINQRNKVIQIKVLTLIATVANISFFLLNRILLQKYLNDFTINIGYLFLFLAIPELINCIYLTEISISLIESQKEYKKYLQNDEKKLQEVNIKETEEGQGKLHQDQ